ncbi:MAG: hypothetical protein A2808_02415 [Candidatus Moranbacteria bacterium RIFCSPHIGHO2_01_FULL_55_24]|nr:MAG: hypothetical protein A2808_02415 [Candidatus Moranbacteria bacterium RIFCSPHIGHO2_01_FULL_55_24]
MEQFEFTFSPETEEEAIKQEKSQEPDLESKTEEELSALYQEKVGINPSLRGFDRETLEAGIKDPEKEAERLRNLEAEENRSDLLTDSRRG